MKLKEDDLNYYGKVNVRKPHLIYKQGQYYYLLTEKADGTRGNFIIVSQAEVNKVANDLASDKIPEKFHCSEILKRLPSLEVKPDLTKEEREYVESRLRNTCYILVANKLLKDEYEGREIWFRKRQELRAINSQPSTKIISSSTAIVPKTSTQAVTPPKTTLQPQGNSDETRVKQVLQRRKSVDEGWVTLSDLGNALKRLKPPVKYTKLLPWLQKFDFVEFKKNFSHVRLKK